MACVDGLKGFPEAINTAFPHTHIQRCIVHMVRNSMKYVPWKGYKAIAADLKRIYQSATEDEALLALGQLADQWDDKYPQISRAWRTHWDISIPCLTTLKTFVLTPGSRGGKNAQRFWRPAGCPG